MKVSAALFLAGATAAGAFAPPAFVGRNTQTAINVAVGDSVPSVDLHEGFPPEMVNLADYSKGKKMILVGLPGAFTPT